jgi:hypothetical protein
MKKKRFCYKCNKLKPDRAHHCSICDKCTLKMDHHCPWVGNCVGWGNYKFFILFLTYTVLLCLVVSVSLISFVIEKIFYSNGLNSKEVQIVITFIVAAVFGLGLFFFAIQHFKLSLSNITTIESFESFKDQTPNPYNIGKKENFMQVFGPSLFLAFLPVSNQPGDGITFPTKLDIKIPNEGQNNLLEV